MKKLSRIIAGGLLVTLIGACTQQASEDVAVTAPPTETAEEFVVRANAEVEELISELQAAGWVRATYNYAGYGSH